MVFGWVMHPPPPLHAAKAGSQLEVLLWRGRACQHFGLIEDAYFRVAIIIGFASAAESGPQSIPSFRKTGCNGASRFVEHGKALIDPLNILGGTNGPVGIGRCGIGSKSVIAVPHSSDVQAGRDVNRRASGGLHRGIRTVRGKLILRYQAQRLLAIVFSTW